MLVLFRVCSFVRKGKEIEVIIPMTLLYLFEPHSIRIVKHLLFIVDKDYEYLRLLT